MRAAYASLREEDVMRLRAVMASLKAHWEQDRFFHSDDREFHLTLFSRINNRSMLSLMEAIWDVDANFRVEQKIPHLEETIVKHENIVRALEARNEEAFEAAMMAHFASGKYTFRRDFSEL